ncbi:MAG: DUF72 domain-containing protein [Firmicutes bacterium]|nr:DUF72 domain-containing protein [Bacillota bacterium]
MGKCWIGTSGWTYRSWMGTFYPKNLKSGDLLIYYTRRFNTVEVNSTFQHFPLIPFVKSWMRKSPENFLFSIKAPRQFTHLKKLNVADPEFVERFGVFLQRIDLLNGKLGPILFELPPKFQGDLELLENFLKFLPPGYQFAVEFRHTDWYCDKVYDLMRKYGVGTAVVSAPDIPFVPVATAQFAYFRFHGAARWYDYHYGIDELRDAALKMHQVGKDLKDIYAYFDNDAGGAAIDNAKTLSDVFQAVSDVNS